ncbi:NUDIX domain-containing protein [Nocardia brasiliensis]|uniref:NUDIX domain-containing protein n=1 Tax=Nocardia brasiliensis TaxID=37326 RepID=UPI0018933701|nr:NUDIX domain-containing protein [Nocardia brasiliensis]MBF6125520.1 NUDIX domain-containing protein [Nocardia brasiliensis]
MQLLLIRAGHLLLTRRHNTGFADGEWQAPGGRIKYDEDVLTAVIRETDEEVGVRLRRECVDMVSAVHIRSPLGGTRMRSPLVVPQLTERAAGVAIGSDGEELHSPVHKAATAQQVYLVVLWQFQQHGTPRQVAAFSEGGPPPPEPADGFTGWILYYEAHTSTVEHVAALLAEMETAGWITSAVRETLAELSPREAIAALKARIVEPDTGECAPSEAG